MNKERRKIASQYATNFRLFAFAFKDKSIDRERFVASFYDKLYDELFNVIMFSNEEEMILENYPENLQYSSRYEEAEEVVDTLSDLASDAETFTDRMINLANDKDAEDIREFLNELIEYLEEAADTLDCI